MTNRLQETDRPRGSGGELRRVLDEWEFKHSPYRFGQKLRNAFMASGAFLIAMAAIMKLVNPATASRGFGFRSSLRLSFIWALRSFPRSQSANRPSYGGTK
jgi:hypothetical protein